MESKPDALLGIRILDLSRVLAGPFLTMLLADMGAEIIKLEFPGRGDDAREFPPFLNGQSMYYVNLNRGKKSITLNLKHPEGKRVFIELVKRCDVLLENFRPGTMERLGLSYEELKKLNPRLVYASISGFGQTGPYRSRPGYDIIGQAMGGLMSITGWPDSPPTRAGTAIGDILSALYTCIGVLAALQVREKTGEGQNVDVALVDSVYASLENIPQKVFVEGEVPGRIGNRYEFIYPYDSFEARDGWVIIGIANDVIWRRFVETTELEELRDPRFDRNPSRVYHHETIRDAIRGWVSERSVEEVVSTLNGNRVPACPIYDLKQASEDPHIRGARGMTLEREQPGLGEVTLLGNPIKMSATDPAPRGPAPELGGDTASVLESLLGLSKKEIDDLREKGAL
jgi:crotonobetainyl-CoA:carnitine CoA-transferase CaiB-like acyl-CoA transferase